MSPVASRSHIPSRFHVLPAPSNLPIRALSAWEADALPTELQPPGVRDPSIKVRVSANNRKALQMLGIRFGRVMSAVAGFCQGLHRCYETWSQNGRKVAA